MALQVEGVGIYGRGGGEGAVWQDRRGMPQANCGMPQGMGCISAGK